MEILQNLAIGFGHLFGLTPILLLVCGMSVGVIAGALPGISFVNAMALALPFTYVMEPTHAMVFLAGLYCGGVFGGSISSILINIPGSPGSLPATWDGYPMTRRGESARALGIAITCSAIGGLASALMMIFVSPHSPRSRCSSGSRSSSPQRCSASSPSWRSRRATCSPAWCPCFWGWASVPSDWTRCTPFPG